MTGWQEQIQKLRDEHEGDWSLYNPQLKVGWEELATHEDLACALCQNLVKVIKVATDGSISVDTDGSIAIGCDYDQSSGGYRRVDIVLDSSVKGGATVSQSSVHGCGRDLLERRSN